MRQKPNNQARSEELLQQADAIATNTDVTTILDQLLAMLLQIVPAQAGAIYLYDLKQDQLLCKATQSQEAAPEPASDPEADDIAEQRPTCTHEYARVLLFQDAPVWVPNLRATPDLLSQITCPAEQMPDSLCYFPMRIKEQPIGLIEWLNLPADMLHQPEAELALIGQIVHRLATDIEKARIIARQHVLLAEAEYREKRAEYREQRLEALIDFISDITTTLERKELIRLIMGYAEKLLDVEATSFWLLDEANGIVKLLVAAGDSSEIMNEVSVEVGAGIIGHVVQTGERKVVNNVLEEPLFNTAIDKQSGFETRSILCVPMRAPRIQRGDLRGEIQETVIGGAQALNKRDGSPFTDDDVRSFETLARQAATAFQFSNLFEEDFTLFWGVVKAATNAIDLIDPYTHGHSERVSDFSVAIAEELDLPVEEIYRVRVGSMLHDVGKIGVDVQVLKKPDRLTDLEFQEMQRHPMYGVKLFMEAGLGDLLGEELMALAQHHERLDGRGYPNGLCSEEISRIGRIVAVADTLDALTSDRPYRAALSVEEAFDILEKAAGTELDKECVEAVMRARLRGKIRVQHERENHA